MRTLLAILTGHCGAWQPDAGGSDAHHRRVEPQRLHRVRARPRIGQGVEVVQNSGTADVALVDAASRKVLASVPLGEGPGFPLFSPDSSRLYVMNSGEGDVAVLDVAAQKVSARHKVGVNPFGGAIRTLAK